MIPNVLIDTDVILDVFLEREPHYTSSKTVLILLDDNAFHGFVTATIIVNIFYHVEKHRDREMAFACVESLLTNPDLVVLDVDKSVLIAALNTGMTDFEDAVQAVVAKSAGIDMIVTRNKRDFRNAMVPAMSPQELLEKLI
jgi:predicted nucleic acid-binding protein